ncbi:Hypothetical protein NTJ_14639 [Nesidiocoris tenuis]|uniref:Uncharacterized protein n=1 Tax=Nesidiocoris tenuis TaxID=355587 RepID=A0ABN7BFE3_9HEMI|nr:Hypothetical protein NTJ_14639 [Nesidiocoris tenuis]
MRASDESPLENTLLIREQGGLKERDASNTIPTDRTTTRKQEEVPEDLTSQHDPGESKCKRSKSEAVE